MQRKAYEITSDNGHFKVMHAWNSSNREIEAIVRDMAIGRGELFELVDKASHKEGFDHVRGHRTWRGAKSGFTVKFEIRKVA